MAALSREAREFLDQYASGRARFEQAALEATAFIKSVLSPLPIAVHAVFGRAKQVASLRGKLRRKRYAHPRTAVTDLIGLRVITYFAADIDRVASQLRASLDISERKCRDARKELEEDQFGYRSVHLIARVKPRTASMASFASLKRRWFEIQIRSILDHAWSEIEHEVVYKAGVDFPRDVRRRFKAVAGSLEVLEHAFAGLAVERDALVDLYKADYEKGLTRNIPFDVARLIAFLEVRRPNGIGWRNAERNGEPLPPGLATAAVEALESAGLRSASSLEKVFKTRRFRRMVTDFAALEGIGAETTAHLALVVLAVATVRPGILRRQFPEMLFSPSIAAVTDETRSIPTRRGRRSSA